MPHVPTFTFDSRALFAVAIALAILCAAIVIVRRAVLPRGAALLALIGLLSLALAAGGLRFARASAGEEVAVMIDASASTRGAAYHDPQTIKHRVAQLLGRTPYRVYQFASQTQPSTLDSAREEVPTRRTILAPPDRAAAIVLFSDGQFALPASAPPVYAVIDPALERTEDAAVENLQIREQTVAITVRNTGNPRDLALAGATPATQPVGMDRQLLSGQLNPAAGEVNARVQSRDAWPENNSLTIRPPPPQKLERWWISHRAPPDPSWRAVSPPQLSFDPTDYLLAGVIALDDVAPDEFDTVQRERIEQYVRDLGGGLLMLGGEHSFAAGGFVGTTFGGIFEKISPLASTPPRAMTHWIFLADSSGSMAARIGDNTRWRFATTAISELASTLPAADSISTGNFAADVRWWRRGSRVADTYVGDLIPDDIVPKGPTNLEPALKQIVQDADVATPTQLVLITDAEAKLPDAAALVQQLKAKRVTVHAITTAPLATDHPLRQIVEGSGGNFIAQADPRRWASALQQVLRSATTPWLMRNAVTAEFTEAGPDLPPQPVSLWNRTWLKSHATLLARTSDAGAIAPMAAAWNYGAGAVIAAAYSPTPAVIDALAERVMVPPRDPRFAVEWTVGPELRIRVDAQEDGKCINDLPLRLERSPAPRADGSIVIPQTAPGRYELATDAPTRATIASVYLNEQLIDRRALAGRYSPEFDAIGNNRANLIKLAEQTGGAVIEPTRQTPIEFRHPRRAISLASPLAMVGFIFLAAGIIRWRLS